MQINWKGLTREKVISKQGHTKTMRLSEKQAKDRARKIWKHLGKIAKSDPVFHRHGFLLVFVHGTFSATIPMSVMGLSEDNLDASFTFDADHFNPLSTD